MLLIAVKYAVTAFIIVLVSEIAKRFDRAGALISSLPLVTIMVMVWIQVETQNTEKIAAHAYYTFWYVIPTLPMFLVMPSMLNQGINFWVSLVTCAILSILCFAIFAHILKSFNIHLIP